MLTVKKQITVFVMLLLVALPVFFSAGIFIRQQMLQFQRNNRFKKEPLVTVALNPENVKWVKYNKEIEIDGKLFDIKTCKLIKGKMVFRGFYDTKEDKLVAKNRAIEKQKNNSKSPFSQSLVKLLLLPNYKETNAPSVLNNWHIISTSFHNYTENLLDLAYPIAAPPPKHC